MSETPIRTKGEALAANKPWVEFRCGCQTVLMPDYPPDMLLVDIAARFRCKKCGRRPEPDRVRAYGPDDHAEDRLRYARQ